MNNIRNTLRQEDQDIIVEMLQSSDVEARILGLSLAVGTAPASNTCYSYKNYFCQTINALHRHIDSAPIAEMTFRQVVRQAAYKALRDDECNSENIEMIRQLLKY